MYKKSLSIVFLFLFFASSTFASGIKPGLWEIKTETSIEGVSMKIPVHTIQTCIKSEKYIPSDHDKNVNCKTVFNNIEGNTTKWKIVCKEQNTTIETVGSLTNMGKTFKSQSETIIIEDSTKNVTRSNITGTYIGPCK